ncbi:MAG: outer membrane beta-barrel protein [Bacteroidota bacterium]|nr:hypothetical protein [Christiangramia sp.]MEE2770744.1 outer membrane beta-barrel protein [Bacteroidota bacterium]|tara:strand:+ start:139 stop:684 length:546 start_codon:yes stop_codon:yes gene_type:complete
MKHSFLLLLFFSSLCQAQFQFGLKAGLNSADIRYNIENYNPPAALGYQAGGMVKYAFCEGFGMQSELQFAAEGHTDDRLNNLNWPLFFRANWGNFGVYGGDQLSFLLSAESGKEYYEKSSFGGIAGVDYQLKSGLCFDLRYCFGTSSVNREFVEIADANGASYYGYTAYPRVFQFSIGYWF